MVQKIIRMGGNSQSLTGAGIAAEPIPKFSAVILDEQCFLVNPGLGEHAGRRLGLATNSANAGATVNILLIGLTPINNEWNWDEGKPIYAGEKGTLTQIPPAAGYLIIVGYPREKNAIFIDPITTVFRG